MNAQNAHEYLPLVQALANGKMIQALGGEWFDIDDVNFNWPPDEYRIKPEPRTFKIVRSDLTGDIHSAGTYEGDSPHWEYITVQEVIK